MGILPTILDNVGPRLSLGSQEYGPLSIALRRRCRNFRQKPGRWQRALESPAQESLQRLVLGRVPLAP